MASFTVTHAEGIKVRNAARRKILALIKRKGRYEYNPERDETDVVWDDANNQTGNVKKSGRVQFYLSRSPIRNQVTQS